MKLLKETYRLLNTSQKKDTIVIVILILIGLIFEMVSIGLVFPLFDYSLHPEKIHKIQLFFRIKENISQLIFLKYSITLILLIYFIKTFFLFYSIKKQNVFATNIIKDLSHELYSGYLKMPYLFHINNNSSKLVRNVNVETGAFLAYLQSLMILISESTIVVSIILLMFFVEFQGTFLLIIFFSLSSYLFNIATKAKMEKLGKERQFHDGEYSKHLLQGLNGVKDIKILGKESFFLKKFEYHNSKRTEILIKNNTIQQVPRLYLEFITVLALSSLIFFFIYTNKSLSYFLPILGLYAASSFRLIPSLNRILVSLSTIKYHKSAVNEIKKELKIIRKNTELNYNNQNETLFISEQLELKNISFSYNHDSKKVLNNLNLKISIGETIGIIGESGAGKSTLVDILIGLISPTEGEYLIDHTPINLQHQALNSIFGYVPQTIFFTDDTLEKNIAFGIDQNNINQLKLQLAISNSQIEKFINDLPHGLQTIVGERGVKLSGGQRQRIGIARALYFDPKILIFDESTSALDNDTELALMETINKLKGKITMILITHRTSSLTHCDKIFQIKNGNAEIIKTN